MIITPFETTYCVGLHREICLLPWTGLRLSKTIESLWRRVTTDIFSKRRKICPAWWHFRGWEWLGGSRDNTRNIVIFLAEIAGYTENTQFSHFFSSFPGTLPKMAMMLANGPKGCGLIILLLQFVCASSSGNTAHEAACQVVTRIIDCASCTRTRVPFVCTLILYMCVLSP